MRRYSKFATTMSIIMLTFLRVTCNYRVTKTKFMKLMGFAEMFGKRKTNIK